MIDSAKLQALEDDLNHFDAQVRSQAVHQLVKLVQNGDIQVAPERDVVNMHCHTFFSFNAFGYSPSGLAWLAKKNGYKLIGIVDFDTLDGVDEFFNACDTLGVRGSAGMETRVFIPEFSDREINSPGEPGVSYYMGAGFISSDVPQEVKPILENLANRLEKRNKRIIRLLNDFLEPLSIDYEANVLPLTPGINATERHIVGAYVQAAQQQLSALTEFWANKLSLSHEETKELIKNRAAFQNTIRKKLMKKGGIGYITPTAETFPNVEEVNKLTTSCGALPCFAWLDGTSQGEQDIHELLDLLIGKGVAMMNIIPDRNWNIPDDDLRKRKVNNLYEIVEIAQNLDLPIIVGTEMNSFGQRLIDDFSAPELQPLNQIFLDGAYFIYGHTVMQRVGGFGFLSTWAQTHFSDRKSKNIFYQKVGRLFPPEVQPDALAKELGKDPTSESVLEKIKSLE